MFKSCDVLNLAMDAGKIMLENGAETYRVEDTMSRILTHYNIGQSEVFVTTTGLFASIGTDTMVMRITIRTINLNKIAMVNELSRSIVAGKYTCEEAHAILKQINVVLPYPLHIKAFMSGLSCFSFAYIFGGSAKDCINGFITGVLLNIILYFLEKNRVSTFLSRIIGGVTVALCSLIFFNIGIGNDIDKIIIGALMPLVPGVGLTNAIRDILEGDFLSGSGRIFDAIIIASAVATGVGIVLKLWLQVFGGFKI